MFLLEIVAVVYVYIHVYLLSFFVGQGSKLLQEKKQFAWKNGPQIHNNYIRHHTTLDRHTHRPMWFMPRNLEHNFSGLSWAFWGPATNQRSPWFSAHLVELALELHPVQAQGVQETPGRTLSHQKSRFKRTCQSYWVGNSGSLMILGLTWFPILYIRNSKNN